MPIRIECDGGCGATCSDESEFVVMGHFAKCYYCEDCAKSVTAFNEARDVLHTDIAGKWQAGLKKLKAKWAKEHSGGSLPDGS